MCPWTMLGLLDHDEDDCRFKYFRCTTDQELVQGHMHSNPPCNICCPFYSQSEVSTPVMCSDVVVYPYQIYQARLAGADALKLLAPALPPKVGLATLRTLR